MYEKFFILRSSAKSMTSYSIVEHVGNHAQVHKTSRFTLFQGRFFKKENGQKQS